MVDLIEEALKKISPEAVKLEIFNAYRGRESRSTFLAGLEEVKAKRSRGDSVKAVLIYGFDSEERIRQHKSGSILDAPGVFYLRLPALLSQIKIMIRKATNVRIPVDGAIDNKSFRDYAVKEIRAFKHRLDNVFTSMEMNANRARKDLDHSPETMPRALLEFKLPNVEKLFREYQKLEALTIRLGIRDADKVLGMINEMIAGVRQLEDQRTAPLEALDIAFQCAKLGRAISNILEQAKEL